MGGASVLTAIRSTIAHCSARLEFGSIERYKEDARRARGLRLIDELRADG
jgi:hypothetical protein